MRIEPLAVTYARALTELASAGGRLEPVLEEVRMLAELLRDVRGLRTFIESPAIAAGEKRTALERALRGKLDDLVVDFVCLVIEKGRQFLLPEIFEKCETLFDEVTGRIHIEATTAVPIDDGRRRDLEEALRAKFKKTVILENKVRPEVLGGLIVRHGDTVADGSVRSALARIAARLESSKIGSEFVHENQPR